MGKKFNHQILLLSICISFMFSVNTGFAEDPVRFIDANLKKIVERTLKVTDPTPTDMLKMEWLSQNGIEHITNLEGLQYAKNLTKLSLNRCLDPETDLSVISSLPKLERLEMMGNNIKDISALTGPRSLMHLYLYNNEISDISSLKAFSNLRSLGLSSNKIKNVFALKEFKKLEYLDLSSNQIQDIFPLKELTTLECLNLTDNQISDISAISNLLMLDGSKYPMSYGFHLRNNPLNDEAYEKYIPMIRKCNAPGTVIAVDFRSEQLRNPAILSIVVILIASICIYLNRVYTKLTNVLIMGFISALAGWFFGALAQMLYIVGELHFYGNGYENPSWLGYSAGAIFGFIIGVCFTQQIARLLDKPSGADHLIRKGILLGIVSGLICSILVHAVLMLAYKNSQLDPIIIGSVIGVAVGAGIGGSLSSIAKLSYDISVSK
jgi:hypothetical protein